MCSKKGKKGKGKTKKTNYYIKKVYDNFTEIYVYFT